MLLPTPPLFPAGYAFEPRPQAQQSAAVIEAETPTRPLLAGPTRFNPALQLPKSSPPNLKLKTDSENKQEKKAQKESTDTVISRPALTLEDMTTQFQRDTDNFGKDNLFLENTALFRLRDGEVLELQTGLNRFAQPNVETVVNTSIKIGWEKDFKTVTLKAKGGIDLFNRLPVAANLHVKATAPIWTQKDAANVEQASLTISGAIDHGSYPFNATTLENQIRFWRFNPSVYWKIDANTSLFSSGHLGVFSDGNQELQSFSRLERKLGQFSLSGNLFTWNFKEDLETRSGYFSPAEFLLVNGEVAWEGQVFEPVNCRLSAFFGKQRLNESFSDATGFTANCSADITDSLNAEIGYELSNVANRTFGETQYRTSTVKGQFNVQF